MRLDSKGFLRIVLLLVLSAPFWDLGHPLWEVDDARYAEVPREMHESGAWLNPTLDYVDYVEKPPLMYWLTSVSYSLFGVNETAAHLPLALLSVLGILGVWWLGSWLYSPRVGMVAGIVLGTTAGYASLSHMITPDMALSVFLLWGTGLILRCLRRPRDGRWAGVLAWTALAGAFLSKGLVALLLPAVWTAALVLLFPGLRRGWKPLLLSWGLPLFLLAVGGWLAAMESRHPGFIRFFFVEQHFLRYLTPLYNRPGPWYYYIGVELAGSLPWTPLILAAAAAPFARWRDSEPGDRQLVLWAALVFAFFSVSSSKLPTYILPLFAHQAVLAAAYLERIEKGSGRVWLRRLASPLGLILLGACLLSPFVLTRIPLEADHPRLLAFAVTAVLGLFGAVQLLLAAGERRETAVRAGLLALCCSALLLAGARALTGRISVKDAGLALRQKIEAAEEEGAAVRVLCYDEYFHGIPFYARRPADVVNWIGELYYAKRMPRYAHRFNDDDALRVLPNPGERTFVVADRKTLGRVFHLSRLDSIRSLETYGRWAVVEY